MRVLVTRPRADAERTAARLRALGHAPLVAPVLAVAPTGEPVPGGGPFDALVVTSANAAPFLAEARETSAGPVFAVGARTADAVAAMGFTDVREGGDGTAAGLADLIRRSLPPCARLLHVAGRDRKDEPAAALVRAGFRVATWEAYAAVTVTELPDAAQRALAGADLDAVLHYSRRSAEALLALARAAGLARALLGLAHLCLSEDVAEPLRQAGGGRRLIVAPRPREDALLDGLATLAAAPVAP